MPQNELELNRELELIVEKLKMVKEAGFGKVEITIQNGIVVYIEHKIGEQVNKGD